MNLGYDSQVHNQERLTDYKAKVFQSRKEAISKYCSMDTTQFPLKLFFSLILYLPLIEFSMRVCTLCVPSYKQVCGSMTPTLKTSNSIVKLQSEYNN